MYNIIKRNGDVVDFRLDKIESAIQRAMDACRRQHDDQIIQTLALRAVSAAEAFITDDNAVAVESIQDCVEKTLSESGYFDVAKSYILYRDQHKKLRQAKTTLLDYQKTVDNYLKTLDWRVKESSTITYSLGGLILGNSGAITANYWLSEVYDEEIADAHRNVQLHLHDLSMLSPYCAGWNLKDLIERGIISVGGRTASKPAAHLGTLANQMVNFLGILQNEWAGAQAFSSFDTYLAPFVKADNLTYDQVKQAIQSFVFGVNTPSRWGCVDTDTEVLSADGFKKYDELKEGDLIYTWHDGRLELNKVRKVIRKPFKGKLHAYKARGYNQTVTPNHRMLVQDDDGEFRIRRSEEVFNDAGLSTVPAAFKDAYGPNILYHELKNRFEDACTHGAPTHDPLEPFTTIDVEARTQVEIDLAQELALHAGYCSWHDGTTVHIDTGRATVVPESFEEIDYDGIVWCPNVKNGTAVFRKDGCVYVSGQTQPPFTNITLDWTVPDDLKDQPAIVGGKAMPFTYGDCKPEMDMVNKAFIDVMLEGDANGRGHEYPIPTYSITPDFDWSDTENNRMLFGMAAKYGIPYFSNYVNSDMKPSDIRSMCPLRADQKVLVMDDYSKEWHISTIKNLYGGSKKDKVYDVLLNGVPHKATINKFDGLRFVKINLMNGHSVIVSTNHLNHVLRKTATGNEIADLPTDAVTPGDYLPFNIDTVEGRGLGRTDGVMVGAFMGDGTLKDDYSVTFSLNNGSKSDLMEWIIDKAKTVYGAKVAINNANESGTCVNVTVTSKMLRGLIEDYVSGQGTEKALDVKAINRSIEFRKGIIEGLIATDGTPAKHRIYTASKNGMESVCTILASLGMPTRVTKDDRSAKDGTLSDNPVWCIRPYDPENGQTSYGDVYRKAEGLMWFRIESIEPQDTTASTGYCFEVLSDDPYFMLPNGLVTHNCRLRLDLNELRRRNGGFFGSGESTGSIGVVTINLPQMAYLSASEDDFFARLDHLMDIAARSLDIKRTAVANWLEAGLYPYTKAYLGHFDNHFSTIGLVGMNEACLNARWLRKDMTSPESHAFAVKVLNHMRDRLVIYQNRYKALFNLEATPAESTAFRFAKHDKEKYPDIITANQDGTPYYTNSTNLPVGWTDDIFAALDAQDDLQTLYTSGTVFHTFLGEQMPDWKSTMNLVRAIAQNYRLPYYTLSPTYSVCHEHGYLPGEQRVCPHCGRKTEIYSRITGYYRAVQNWNDGKVQEFEDRKTYDTVLGGGDYAPGTKPAHAAPGPAQDGTCGPDGCHFGFEPEPDGCGPDGCEFGDTGVYETDAVPDDAAVEDSEILPDSYPVPPGLMDGQFILKTRTCSKCRSLDDMLEARNIKIPPIYAEDYIEWVRAIGATESPTLIRDGIPVAHGLSAVIDVLGLR